MDEMPLSLALEGCAEAYQTRGARSRGDTRAQREQGPQLSVNSGHGAGSRWPRVSGYRTCRNWGLQRVLSSLSDMMGHLAVQ